VVQLRWTPIVGKRRPFLIYTPSGPHDRDTTHLNPTPCCRCSPLSAGVFPSGRVKRRQAVLAGNPSLVIWKMFKFAKKRPEHRGRKPLKTTSAEPVLIT
jgi:hypothetical protein